MKRRHVWAFLALLFCVSTLAYSQNATLRFFWWGGDSRHTATLAAIDAFQKKFPSIKIEPEYAGWDGYYTKLSTMVASGGAPDIMQTDVKFMPDLMAQGDVLLDLRKYKDVIDMSGFEQKFVDSWGVVDGKIIGLPTGTNARTSILNLDFLKSHGIPENLDWTWRMILEEGKKIHAKDASEYFLLLDPEQVSLHIMRAQLQQITGLVPFSDTEFKRNFSKADLDVTLNYIKSLFDANVLVPFEQSAVHSVNQMENPLWINGKVGFYLNYTTHIVPAIANAPKYRVGVARFPLFESVKDTAITIQPAQLFCISSTTKYPKEAAMFVNFLFNDPAAIRALKLERSVPAVAKARDLLANEKLLTPQLAAAINIALKNAGKRPSNLETNAEISAILKEGVEAIGYKTMTVEQVSVKIISKIDSKLAEFQAQAKK
ncbi:MAG: ABC transporter substrate-binding protein [Spirochaetes bacterium]|nr:ABC transporter substrate-binding protein [Spirochaetota bacterium]